MPSSLDFILGLLAHDFASSVSWGDFSGEHGKMLRLWQRWGFLAKEPGRHPVLSCPHCCEGSPSSLGGQYICDACGSPIDTRHLLLWRFDLDAFLAWLAKSLTLEGGVRPIGESLWQLGSMASAELRYECFFLRSISLSTPERTRLLAYRNTLLLAAIPVREGIEGFAGPCLSLLELLRADNRSLTITDPLHLLRSQGAVRFDAESGGIWMGDVFLGEVAVGSKEHALLACLAQHLDRFVPYGDIKHDVLRRTGSTDETDEATFCQKLKSRIKKCIPKIDVLIATTNKGDGYRMRGAV